MPALPAVASIVAHVMPTNHLQLLASHQSTCPSICHLCTIPMNTRTHPPNPPTPPKKHHPPTHRPASPPQLASGEVFGSDQPIALHLLGSDRSREAVEGVAMELEDSLYPLLREVGALCTLGAVLSVGRWGLEDSLYPLLREVCGGLIPTRPMAPPRGHTHVHTNQDMALLIRCRGCHRHRPLQGV